MESAQELSVQQLSERIHAARNEHPLSHLGSIAYRVFPIWPSVGIIFRLVADGNRTPSAAARKSWVRGAFSTATLQTTYCTTRNLPSRDLTESTAVSIKSASLTFIAAWCIAGESITALRAAMEQFKVEKLIGSGTYSDVYESKFKKSGDKVALKRIKPQSLPAGSNSGEVSLQETSLVFPHLVNLNPSEECDSAQACLQ